MKFIPLEAAAMEWLRYRHGCYIVMMERGQYAGRPDVMGVTEKRFLLEIEVKRTVSDFKADAKKEHRCRPGFYAPPVRRLWYIVPPSIVEKARPLLTDGAGLLTVDLDRLTLFKMPEPRIVVSAKTRNVQPVTDEKLWRLVRDMAGTLVSTVCRHNRDRWKREPIPV